MAQATSVSLLVKARSLPPAQQFALGVQTVSFVAKPLMPSIDRAAGGLLGAATGAQWYHVTLPAWSGSAWDACHALSVPAGLGAAAGVEFVEPDLPQQWLYEPSRDNETALAAATCAAADPQNTDYPTLPNNDDWFRDDAHGQFRLALSALPTKPPVVRVAHLDTGYDPQHRALPKILREDLAKSFVDEPAVGNAHDVSSGICNNRGHGTGTISILAGRDPSNPANAIGAAPFVEVIPIRVANRVVLFSNGSIARALDYVHALCAHDETRVHIVTMSMGGLASQAWAEAINALYEIGVFVVTAAGNNYANLPTHNIVYPARFNRVVAACGVMADGKAYADLSPLLMAGNYGPTSKMNTTVTAYTPNTPWARLGCEMIVDHDGGGTSAATPQVAAAAALWIAKNQAAWSGYSQGWMRAEAIRSALFSSAEAKDVTHFGHGWLKANAALAVVPPEGTLTQQPKDDAEFALLRGLFGVGLAAAPDAKQRMLELEALQLAQSGGYEHLVPETATHANTLPLARALLGDGRASQALRAALSAAVGAAAPAAPVVQTPTGAQTPKPQLPGSFTAAQQQAQQLAHALQPKTHRPKRRTLQSFAFDPSLGASLETLGINEALLDMNWESLKPGPIGEYLEVIDIDPASKSCYAPVDLDDPYLLAQRGLRPSETDPRFHQQMAYAVASRTIEYFERALGRVALWAPRRTQSPAQVSDEYVQRLRIYPHALRAANAYYSPDKKALLLGYFSAAEADPFENAPGTLVFAALSHDIVAHETTHALLDGLHRRYTEATNPDVLAFHEGFADLVALFQHFTLPEALKAQIANTRGDLRRQSLLGELAVQFGHATGSYGALRDAIGGYDDAGVWRARAPSVGDYRRLQQQSDPHALGAVLVAAVFDAFLQLNRARTRDLIRLATGGTGILGEGALSADLTERLAEEAARLAGHCLEICIRALDYCPPIDITFSDYLRALITSDRDIAPDDPLGYRVAFVAAFRARGIVPSGVSSISADSIVWEPPPLPIPGLITVLGQMWLGWDLHANRESAYRASRHNAAVFQKWLASDAVDDNVLAMLGLVRHPMDVAMGGQPGHLGGIEVHSVRPARRIGPNRQSRAELIIEITQTWRETPANVDDPPSLFRGGCTLVVDLEKNKALYLVRKRIDHGGRFDAQTAFQASAALNSLRANYYNEQDTTVETFAALHDAR